MSKRFVNMPLNSYLTVIGQVKRRPNNLRNLVSLSLVLTLICTPNPIEQFCFFYYFKSIPTGGVEVHVSNIIRVQKIYRPDSMSGFIPTGKR